MRILLTLFIATFCFAIDPVMLSKMSDQQDSKGLQKIIDATKVYEEISQIPDGMVEGDALIVEDEYGAKTFFIQDKDGNINEFSHFFFAKLLNKDSGSTFSNIFTSSTGEKFETTTSSSKSDSENPFKAYVSETDAVRIEQIKVSPRADYMEQALNDHLLNNDIEPASIINMQLIPDKEGDLTLYFFYRP